MISSFLFSLLGSHFI